MKNRRTAKSLIGITLGILLLTLPGWARAETRNPLTPPSLRARSIPQRRPASAPVMAAMEEESSDTVSGREPSLGGTVNLPLQDYRELIEQAEGPAPEPEPEAPFAYALIETRYSGQVKEDELEFAVELKVNVLGSGWVTVKLMKSDPGYAVEKFSAGDLEAELRVDDEGDYTVTLNQPGVHLLHYTLHVPLQESFDEKTAEFPTPASAMTGLELRSDRFYRVSIKPTPHGVETEREGSGLRFRAVVPKAERIAVRLGQTLRESYAFTSARFRGEVREGVMAIAADYGLEIFYPDPGGLPIADLGVALGSVLVDGKPQPILTGEEAFQIRNLSPGRHQVHLELFQRIEESEEARSVKLPVNPAPISTLSVTVPGEAVNLEIQPGVNQAVSTQGKKTTAAVILPLTDAVTISWTEKAPELKKVVSAKEQALRLHADTRAAAHLEDGIVRVEAKVEFAVLRGELSQLAFTLPAGAEVMSVEGKYIRDWTSEKAEAGTGYRVYLDRKVRGSYGLKVQYEMLMDELPVTVEYPGLEVREVEREKGTLVVMRNPGLKIKPVRVEGLSRIESEEAADDDRGALLVYKYLKKPYALTLEISEPEVPEPEVTARLATLLSVEEGIWRCYTHIDYSILYSGVDTFTVRLPAEVKLSAIYGQDIRSKKINSGPDYQEAVVSLNKRVRGSYQLFVDYEKILPESKTGLAYPFLELPGLKMVAGYLGVQALNNVEIQAKPEKNVQEIDLSQLPSIVSDRADSLILMAFNYTALAGLDKPPVLRFTVHKHADVGVQEVVVDEARYMTLVLENGVSWTQVIFSIRNKGRQFLKIKLPYPEVSQIRTAFLAGQPVRPSKNEQGEILLPLAKSETDQGRLVAFPLEFVYFSPLPASGTIGRRQLALPEPDVTVIKTQWMVYLPGGYDYRRFHGNMTILRAIKQGDQAGAEFLKTFGSFLSGNFLKFQAKAKQSEAKTNLGAIYVAQLSYFSNRNTYAPDFKEVNWGPAGWNRYAYYMGNDSIASRMPNSGLGEGFSQGLTVNNLGFLAMAVGNIDNDPFQDIWIIDQNKRLINLADDNTDSFNPEYEQLRNQGLIFNMESLLGSGGLKPPGASAGVLPIHLEIPRQGQLFQFEKLFASEDQVSPQPQVSFWYLPAFLGKTLQAFKYGTLGLILLFLTMIAVRSRRAPRPSAGIVVRHWKWLIPLAVVAFIIWRSLS